MQYNLLEQLVLYRPGRESLLLRLGRFAHLKQEEISPKEPDMVPGKAASLEAKEQRKETLEGEFESCLQELLEFAESHGLCGNLWHAYLTWHIVYHENAFSRACEITGHARGSINQAALLDLSLLRRLFGALLLPDEATLHHPLCAIITDYECSRSDRLLFNSRIADRINALADALARAESDNAFKALVETFYGEFGVGKLGLHKAFRLEEGPPGKAEIVPITNIMHVTLQDLVGYESAKAKLVENTEAFLAGRPANNCLLFGDAGTGKSSSIKAILNQYYDRGLRIIEIYKHQFRHLNHVIGQIKNRNYRFIIYMDDLSFEDSETDYKYLKAVIEGGLEKKPDNILIYATSNRRHLIRENYADKFHEGDEIRQDMHTSDTVQEKLSLAYRFGVTIYFGSPNKQQFQQIVRVLANRNGITLPQEELLLAANAWELHHGGLSGRTAQQFIDHLLGQTKEPGSADLISASLDTARKETWQSKALPPLDREEPWQSKPLPPL